MTKIEAKADSQSSKPLNLSQELQDTKKQRSMGIGKIDFFLK